MRSENFFFGPACEYHVLVTLVEPQPPSETWRLSAVLRADSRAVSHGQWRAELSAKTLGLIGSRLFRSQGAEVEFGTLTKGEYELKILSEISGELLLDIDVMI